MRWIAVARRAGAPLGISPGLTRRLGRVLAGLALLAGGLAQAEPLRAPNVVVIDPTLVTSGQPDADALARLDAQGFAAVVYLAPPTVPDAVADEARIVARQGLLFANLPIPFDAPTAGHYRDFAGLMRALAPRRVLVHCQINLRASTMVFLYRVIERHEDPRAAWAAVAEVWIPSGPWKTLVRKLLQEHGIAFEPM